METGKAVCLIKMMGLPSYMFQSEWDWSGLDERVASVVHEVNWQLQVMDRLGLS